MTHVAQRAAYIADIAAWTGAQEETLRIATHSFSTLPSDNPPNATYLGVISDVGVIDRAIFQGSGTNGVPQISEGYIEVANTGLLDGWLDYGFDGRAFTIRRLNIGSLYVSAQTMFTGTLVGLDASNAWTTLRLRIRDLLRALDTPLLTARYAGTTTGPGATAEGTDDLKDQLKPIVFGNVRNISPKLVNPFDLVYQVSLEPVSSIAVKFAGEALVYDTDYATLTALVAATIPDGAFATCLEMGLFRLANSPIESVVTADVVETSTVGAASVAQIAVRMLDYMGVDDIDATSVTDADTFNDAEAGIYIAEDTTALDLIGRVLDSAGMAIIPDTMGVFRIVIMRDPTALTPVASFTLDDIAAQGATLQLLAGVSSEGEGIPAYSIVLNYDRNYTPMDQSQIAGIVTDEDALELKEDNKTVNAQDITIQEAHLLAVELTKDTLLTMTADAQAEANRLLDLFGTRRDRIAVQLHDEDADDVELGDCVLLTLDRFGWNGGKKFLVLGKRHEFRTRRVTLNLWG